MSPPRCVYFLFPTLDYRKEPINPKVDGSRNIADLAGKHADLESFFQHPRIIPSFQFKNLTHAPLWQNRFGPRSTTRHDAAYPLCPASKTPFKPVSSPITFAWERWFL